MGRVKTLEIDPLRLVEEEHNRHDDLKSKPKETDCNREECMIEEHDELLKGFEGECMAEGTE